ncbi:MAG: GNAT family N-acetyltransferase [Candidatus Sericytochromatia bacterium]
MSSLPPDSRWRLRPACLADAAEIASVHVTSWQATYRGLLPDKLLNGLSVARRSQQWQTWIAEAAPDSIWVGEAASGLAGFVIGGPERSGQAHFEGEIQAIYLRPDFQGLGLGKALFQHMQQRLCEQGRRHQLVWVLTGNQRASQFYARQGGQPTLQRQVQIGEPPVTVNETGYTWHF